MFEKEIKFIGDFCLNRIKHLGLHFTFDKINTTDLHPAIVRYISAELDFMIYSDRRKLLQQSYFDYSGKEIAEHFKKINEEIKKSKRIAFDDARRLITQAVSFNANFVVRPNWSLSHLIYNDQDTVSFSELEMMLNYIYYYEHLKNILLAYLSKRKIEQVSKAEFGLILKKIDQELLKSNTEKLIDNVLNSIGDFFNIGGVDRNLVSPVAVEIFFKEKNLFNYLLKLRKGITDPSKKIYNINALKRVIYAPEISEQMEEEQLTESDDISLGELAEQHAENLDKAGFDDLVNPEEEEALLALYDEEMEESLQEGEDQSEPGHFQEDDISSVETGEESYSELREEMKDEIPEKLSPGKEIVDEMMRDFFGDEIPAEKEEQQPVEEEAKESATEEKTEKIKTPEDDFLEIFEELDDLGSKSDEQTETKKEIKIDSPVITEIDQESEPEIEEKPAAFDEEAGKVESAISSDLIEEEVEPEVEETMERKSGSDESDNFGQHRQERRIRKKDLFSYLSRKEMKKIVSHIFLKDEEDFTNTLEKIMECDSYKEATDILKSVFTSYKISPYSKDAVNFTNAVSNYFRQA